MKKFLFTLFLPLFLIIGNTAKSEVNFLKFGDFKVEKLENTDVVESKDIINDKKPNLIVVVAEWCPDCTREMPEIEKFHKEYKDKVNVIVIYSNDRTTKERCVSNYVDNKFTFDAYFDINNEVYALFTVKNYPSTYFISNGNYLKLKDPVTYEKLKYLFD